MPKKYLKISKKKLKNKFLAGQCTGQAVEIRERFHIEPETKVTLQRTLSKRGKNKLRRKTYEHHQFQKTHAKGAETYSRRREQSSALTG